MSLRPIASAAAALGFAFLAPLAAAADSSPSPVPSPNLQSILVAPPASYTAPAPGHLDGNLTAPRFAASFGVDATRMLDDLQLDGFVAGFVWARADAASGRTMTELVMAFTGHKGAIRFMSADHAEQTADPRFQRADPISEVGPNWYGVHLAQASPVLVVDGFEFVKGNDMFAVAVDATHDDVGSMLVAQGQARAQYSAAPPETIPSSEWPDNEATPSSDQGFSFGSGPELFIGVAIIAALFAAGVFVWMRQNEQKPTKPRVEQRMTADGLYWWNGTYWIASSEFAPPWARRSPDGAFWWDGHAWHAVPRPAAPAGR